MIEDNASFLGRGWSFPPRFDGNLSQLELVQTEEDIRESIFILLSTMPGERCTNPEYGCNVYNLIWKPIDKTTKYLIKEAITKAITRYEPRIDLEEVHLDSDDREGTIFVHLEYTIRRINVRTNVVYPFYKIEGTDIIES